MSASGKVTGKNPSPITWETPRQDRDLLTKPGDPARPLDGVHARRRRAVPRIERDPALAYEYTNRGTSWQ